MVSVALYFTWREFGSAYHNYKKNQCRSAFHFLALVIVMVITRT